MLSVTLYVEAEKAMWVGGKGNNSGTQTLTSTQSSDMREAISSLKAAGATVDGSGNGGARREMQVIMRD